MKQKLVFKLDNPTIEKWELWKGLSATTDKICSKYGLICESRIFNEANYSVELIWVAPDAEAIIKCQYDIPKMEIQHGVPSTCISATQNKSPEMTTIQIKLKLAKGQRTNEMFNTWIQVAKTIDAETRRHNIYVKRTPDPENFSMNLHVSYINHFDWSYISYFAGAACGKAGIELLHYEAVIDTQCEDILDQITHVTGKHNQLSFFPKLKQA